MSSYKFFKTEQKGKVMTVTMNRPEKRNAMNWDFWSETPKLMRDLENDDSVNVVIIKGAGADFSLGLDLKQMIGQINGDKPHDEETAEDRINFRRLVIDMQEAINSVARLEKPTIAAIHGNCIGGGLDLISACDMRLASADAVFSLREVRVAIVADMGSLQRLPAIIGEGNTRRLAFTGEDIDATRAEKIHLVDEVFEDQETLFKAAEKLAGRIGKNSAAVLQGIKAVMNFSHERNISAALDNVITWNSAFIKTQEFGKLIAKVSRLPD